MISTKFKILILISALHYVLPQRRITNAKQLSGPKRYVVYIVKAPAAKVAYDAWLCGGALVTRSFIVTSAACMEDVQHMYAIAGYNRSVNSGDLDTDPCTKDMKKKIVLTCVPKAYNFNYTVEQWAFIDIGVAKVESPFDFESDLWLSKCSYKPDVIALNLRHQKYQTHDVDAIVLGWGHTNNWRQPGDSSNYNQNVITYASVRLYSMEKCKQEFSHVPSILHFIDKYMICSSGQGNLNDGGEPFESLKELTGADGCTTDKRALRDGKIVCQEDEKAPPDYRKTFSNILRRQQNMTRRNGFCQNDHGGPLVTWMGSHEILIGVASVFRVTTDRTCTGPYLYTSIQCNSGFLDCVINAESKNSTRRAFCDRPASEKGFDKIERKISWKDHPGGAADNEMIQIRPQKPISDYFFHN